MDDRAKTEPERMQLAGMALQNGVLVLGPTSWAVAIRTADGSIRTTADKRPSGGERISTKVPLLRGPVRLANMLRVLPTVRMAEPDARLGMESRTMLAGMVVGTIVTTRLRRRVGSIAVGELAAGAFSLAMTLASMRTGEVAAYHGAEHKAIGGYEQGIEAVEATREHPRCGTQLAIPMLVFSSVATQGALALAPRNPRVARIAGQLLGVAAATELFRAGAKGRGTALATAAARAGLKLQTHATTVEPSRDQLDVAEAALAALLEAEALVAA
ncbi:MAG: hypothetical protein JWL76_1997 [Thermoleophilia bacterium]|nr:hypothetical protein [Thermoleophilia bacterium]